MVLSGNGPPGGYANGMAGTPGTLSTDTCTVDTLNSRVTGTGTTLTVILSVTFPASFAGTHKVWSFATNREGLATAWTNANLGSVTVTQPTTYSITVQVMAGSTPLDYVTVTLSGPTSAVATTGPNNTYTFAGLLAGGNYTISASKSGYQFAQVQVPNLTGNQTAPLQGQPATSGPVIGGISPASAPVGTPVTITGANFGATPGSVSINGIAMPVTGAWTNSSVVVIVPNNVTAGAWTVVLTTAAQVSSLPQPFTVIPVIRGLSLTQGPAGMGFTINGTNFGDGTNSTVMVPFAVVPNGWGDTSITVQVPSGTALGGYLVSITVRGASATSPTNFTVSDPFGCM